jgi:hypothetical protein
MKARQTRAFLTAPAAAGTAKFMTKDPLPGRPLTAEDVVRRIAAECAFVSANGEVGIRIEPAAALVRQYAEQFRRAAPRRRGPRTPKPPPLL